MNVQRIPQGWHRASHYVRMKDGIASYKDGRKHKLRVPLTDWDHFSTKCTATTASGKPCGNFSVLGAPTCRHHGSKPHRRLRRRPCPCSALPYPHAFGYGACFGVGNRVAAPVPDKPKPKLRWNGMPEDPALW